MSLLDAVERLRAGLDYHLQRHNVLVSNLAQADTPNYKPVDLERAGFEGQLDLAMTATDASHFGTPPGAEPAGKIIADPTAATGPDGNGVDLDREAVKIATNQIRYDMLAQLASSELSSLEWAATDGRNG